MYCDLHASPSRPFLPHTRSVRSRKGAGTSASSLESGRNRGVQTYDFRSSNLTCQSDSKIRESGSTSRCVCTDLSQNEGTTYTIASSPLSAPNRVHLAVTVVEEKVNDDEVDTFVGLCSGFLDSSRIPDRTYLVSLIFFFDHNPPTLHHL